MRVFHYDVPGRCPDRHRNWVYGRERDWPQNHGFIYVVTAAHCLFDDLGEPDEIAIRLNTRAGASDEIMVSRNMWITHPDSDVAILPHFPDLNTFEFSAYNADGTAPKKFREERKIGPGDETFTTGLLVYHPGETRIMPVMRVGSIAAIPSDPVRLRIGKHPGAKDVDEHVILTEVRSIGGVSETPGLSSPAILARREKRWSYQLGQRHDCR